MTYSEQTQSAFGSDRSSKVRVELSGTPLTWALLDEALGRPISVKLTEEVRTRVAKSEEAVRRIAGGTAAAYGINTGFGHLRRVRVPADQLEELQSNLIVSHAVGVGNPIPVEIVRWMILFKIHALTHGVSGVSLRTIDCLTSLLERDLLPVVPCQGSLGASGDLAPLAHMVLPILGMGFVNDGEREVEAGPALKSAGIEPVKLGPKEGLGLINGTQMMSAYAAHVIVRARRLLKHADIITTMSLEGLEGSVRPFDERLHALRPHAGAIVTARNVRRLMEDSEILQAHANCDRVQDPYSCRCVPQVHGASRDAIAHVASVVETEINSVTDNPLVFDGDEVISGGLFHGQPLALGLDYLAIALAEIASISERRIYLLLNGSDGLPALLMQNTGLNSGFMLPQYTAAALVSENKGLCTPASVDSIPTSLGQEDHVSMGARSAVKCLQVLENAETVLSIEMMCAAQAIDFRSPLTPGVGPRAAHEQVRRHIDHADHDRLFGEDIRSSLALLRSREVLRSVEAVSGALE